MPNLPYGCEYPSCTCTYPHCISRSERAADKREMDQERQDRLNALCLEAIAARAAVDAGVAS